MEVNLGAAAYSNEYKADLSEAIAVAERNLIRQGVNIKIDTQKAEELLSKALDHIDKYFSDELKAIFPFNDIGMGALMVGYYFIKNMPNYAHINIPSGDNEIKVDLVNINRVFTFFKSFKDFCDFAKNVCYYTTFDQTIKISSEHPPEEYKAGIFIYTGFFILLEEMFELQDRSEKFNNLLKELECQQQN